MMDDHEGREIKLLGCAYYLVQGVQNCPKREDIDNSKLNCVKYFQYDIHQDIWLMPMRYEQFCKTVQKTFCTDVHLHGDY